MPAPSLDWDGPNHALWSHQCQRHPGYFPCLLRDLFSLLCGDLGRKDRLVDFNAKPEVISQIISISSPLLAFLFVDRFGLKPTLLLDSLTFFLSFALLFSIRQEEKHVEQPRETASVGAILRDIREGLLFIFHEKEVFFLLVVAALVNFLLQPTIT